jgi:hypothetical protein
MAVFVGISSDCPNVKEMMTMTMLRTNCAVDSRRVNHMGIVRGNMNVKKMTMMIPRNN